MSRTYPQGLREAWELRDRWEADGKVQTPPDLYRDLEDDALRAEDRWRAGNDPAVVQEVLHGQVSRIEARRNALPGATDQGEPRLLGPRRGRGPQAPAGQADGGNRRSQADGQPGRAGRRSRPQLEARKKAFLKEYDGKPFALSWTVFQAAKEHPETRPERAARLAEPAADERGGRGRTMPRFIFWKLLAALAAKDPAVEWPAAAVGAALELTDEAEQADAEVKLGRPVLAGPLAQWLLQWREEADGRRQAALDLLLNAKPAERGKAAGPLEAALTDARGFRAAKEAVRGLRAARALPRRRACAPSRVRGLLGVQVQRRKSLAASRGANAGAAGPSGEGAGRGSVAGMAPRNRCANAVLAE